MPLKNQVVLITGCSSGIGRSLVPAFAEGGHRVFATARNPGAIADLKNERVEILALDVTKPDSIKATIESVLAKAGRIDMIVNNAGWNLIGPLAEIPLEDFRREMETNVTGPLALCQAIIPHMAKQKSGRIVNVGSVVGVLPTPFAGAYCASKSCLHTLTEVLRVEVAPFGIGVVLVQPGAIKSSLSQNADVGLERYEKEGSLYRPLYKSIKMRAGASQAMGPTPAEEFARKFVAAVTRDKAPRTVRIGKGAQAAVRAKALLPAQALDAVMTARFRLKKLAK